MTLVTLTAVLADLGFMAVGVATVMHWHRRRDRTNASLALALGSLAILGFLGIVKLAPGSAGEGLAMRILSEVVLMVSGYSMLRVRSTVVPLGNGWLRLAAATGTIATLVLVSTQVLPLMTRAPVDRQLATVAGTIYVLAWCLCVGEPVVVFWRAARERTAVQRARVRALALGFGGLILALFLALTDALLASGSGVGGGESLLAAIAGGVSVLVPPLLYVSVVPPAWLRRQWRHSEELEFRRASRDLVAFSPDADSLASAALPWALRLVGADKGLITDGTGKILARAGLTTQEAEVLAWDQPEIGETRIHRVGLSLSGGNGLLVLVAGPLTPLLGGDELESLVDFAAALALAIDRVKIVEALSRQTRENQALLSAISDMGEGVVVVEGSRFVSANAAYLEMLGYSASELRTIPALTDLIVAESRDQLAQEGLLRPPRPDEPRRYDTGLIRKDGSVIDVEIGTSHLDASPPRTLAIVRDIRARKENERQLLLLGQTDSLTGVGNRHSWEVALDGAVARAHRDGSPLSLVMIDLDGFKNYNDDWGHQRGDALLRAMVSAWKSVLRDVDVLIRFGGDEFALLLPACDLEPAREVMQRLSESVPERQTISAGIAVWDGKEAPSDLLARADGSLYAAKRMGGGRIHAASPGGVANDAVSWSSRLLEVVRDGGMESVYQPIVSLLEGGVVGHEALARPTGAAAGTSVEELFAAAQRLGFSRDLDWIGRRAAVQGGHLLESGLLFINVGLWSFLDPIHDVDQMLLLLKWAGRSPATVVLEMSEREVVSDVGRLREVLASYREEGFRFALDDVGEGHSTLEVLAAADAEYIKVARSLTQRASEPGAGSAIRALAAFASSTGAHVIAEGIENNDMVEQIRDLGVELGQGYGLGRPRRLAPGVVDLAAPPEQVARAAK
ncbi:MAG: EAL domain-containing protein [Candidatus Dormibacteria bacterium]